MGGEPVWVVETERRRTRLEQLGRLEQATGLKARVEEAPPWPLVIFERARFAGADLAGLDLSRFVFSECDFTGANLAQAVLHGCHFHGSKLVGAVLTGAGVVKADFCYADLTGADLSGANAVKAEFYCAIMRSARLRSADMQYAWMTGIDLTDADLRLAQFSGRESFGFEVPCILDRARFSGATGLDDILEGTRIIVDVGTGHRHLEGAAARAWMAEAVRAEA